MRPCQRPCYRHRRPKPQHRCNGSGEGPSFSEAQGPWVDEQLPQSAPNAAMTEAWENTLAGVYELALNNDPMLAMAEANHRVN